MNNIYLGTQYDGKIYKLNKISHTFYTFVGSNTDYSVNKICFDNDYNLYAGLVGLYYLSSQYITPVELTNFTSNVVDNDVLLYWQTVSEINNRGFEIEKKYFGNNWITIGFKNGKGTTTELNNYNFTDKNISTGVYQYRLKQIDFNGSFSYSNVIEAYVESPTQFALSQNHPNPFNPVTIIKYSIPALSNVSLKVFNALGQEVVDLIEEEKDAGEYQVEFNASNLSSGIYFCRLQAGNFVQTRKMVLVK